jgi:hypothetical protein
MDYPYKQMCDRVDGKIREKEKNTHNLLEKAPLSQGG